MRRRAAKARYELALDYDALAPANDPCRPEKNLLLGILERAMRDVCGIRGVNAGLRERHHARAAREWLELDEDGPFCTAEPWSFGWICEHLNLNTAVIHSQLKRAIVTGDIPLFDEIKRRVEHRSFRYYAQNGKPCQGTICE